MKTLDGRYSVNPPFIFHALEENGENSTLTMYAKEPIEVGYKLIINGFKPSHPHSILFNVSEIVENRDHRGFIETPEKKVKSFFKVRGSFEKYTL